MGLSSVASLKNCIAMVPPFYLVEATLQHQSSFYWIHKGQLLCLHHPKRAVWHACGGSLEQDAIAKASAHNSQRQAYRKVLGFSIGTSLKVADCSFHLVVVSLPGEWIQSACPPVTQQLAHLASAGKVMRSSRRSSESWGSPNSRYGYHCS
jgi:hypothetical protein